VGSYLPNAWGLYDMYNNAWEWCLDWWVGNLGTAAVTDPVGGSGKGKKTRVLRGAGWKNGAQTSRSAFRENDWGSPTIVDYSYGFRMVVRPPVRADQ
jgi:formylglycine-generating enzyme required for sulfatase activity